jgi:hypothetical protein
MAAILYYVGRGAQMLGMWLLLVDVAMAGPMADALFGGRRGISAGSGDQEIGVAVFLGRRAEDPSGPDLNLAPLSIGVSSPRGWGPAASEERGSMLRLGSAACCFVAAVSVACNSSTPPVAHAPGLPPDAAVKSLADTYLSAYLDRYPEQATYFGIQGRRHDKMSDNSLESLKAWEAREDAWLTEAQAIDASKITAGPLRATYAIVREALESSISARVCRNELWTVSQTTGWHISDGYLVTIQPVGTAEARQDAVARWGALPKYLDTEIANLREGVRLKYTAPRGNVRIVISQVDALIDGAASDSPFMSPPTRDKDPAFGSAYGAMYKDQLVPAFKRYRDYLEKEYLPAAREDIAVAANPDGLACHAASVRAFSSIPVAPGRCTTSVCSRSRC